MSINIKSLFIIFVLLISSSGIMQNNAFGDSTGNFAVLASTYTNTAAGTFITGDIGYTTGPKVVPTISGITHVADSVYSKAGTSQNTATAVANSQACTTHLGITVDLSLVNDGVYTPGVYCTTGSASIGINGITLSGNGIYIFKIDGTLTTITNSDVTLTNGAQASNISWVPTQATTLGANSNFAGTILDASGVTIGNGASIVGRVLAFGGTVSTGQYATVTVPSYSMADAIPVDSQCTFSFPKGAIDLGSNVQHPAKIYPPGIYCIDGSANIGSGPITLTGNGVHTFIINGALKQAANTSVILINGAQSSDVYWILTGATTIDANSHLIGNVYGAPITIGANSDINGIKQAKTMAAIISGNFGILASTYTNTALGTSITGDVGYVNGPKVMPTISGSTHVSDFVYLQAGLVQNAATSSTNSQACTTHLGITVDLSLVNGGVYTPGVYCTTGSVSIGTNGITLSGNGIYIFKINGALTTVAKSNVILTNGAQASTIFWVPTQATTLGANSNFAGLILDASGVTISSQTNVVGRVLAFGGTVSTGPFVTITTPSYSMADAIPVDSQCTFSFPKGAIDLGSNVQHPAKIYPPGIYCIDGSANIGSGPITLTGNGVHTFIINGAFDQTANTDVILSNNARASDVYWITTGAITLGANSHLIGTVNGAPITIGANSDINGIKQAKTMTDTIQVPKFVTKNDIYVPTQIPTSVNFFVTAVDGMDKAILVECDQYSGHVFKVGKTPVHCMATDSLGNEIRGSFTVTVGYNIVEIPSWFKNTTMFWVDGKITDKEFFQNIEYMLENGIIVIPNVSNITDNSYMPTPSWIKTSSESWVDEKLGNDEFSIVIQWFIENGFIKTMTY